MNNKPILTRQLNPTCECGHAKKWHWMNGICEVKGCYCNEYKFKEYAKDV